MLSGRRALFRVRAGEPGEVIELDRECLQALVQTDAELGRDPDARLHPSARRAGRARHGRRRPGRLDPLAGDARIKEFLTRNGHPYAYIDLDQDPDVQGLLDRFHVDDRRRARC